MSISLNPYLNFHGTAREALEFYHSVLGGEIRLMQYDSVPGVMGDSTESDKIMHGQIGPDPRAVRDRALGRHVRHAGRPLRCALDVQRRAAARGVAALDPLHDAAAHPLS
ncbi:hypothetical protein [Leucobacter sp. NPDC077196]|uniref:hypothetical protein n=1 Tax=Leucobacter sp. NPDC077196 TaxID=3154959 RepID=UPI003425A613